MSEAKPNQTADLMTGNGHMLLPIPVEMINATESVPAWRDYIDTVAHDLKNTLTTIKGTAQLARRVLSQANPPGTEPNAAAWLARVDILVGKMDRQLDDLLDVGRLQAGQSLALDCQLTDLVELARRVAADYQATTQQHTILVKPLEPILIGWWDAPRLERVLGNLLSNAIKYSPSGGEIVLWATREQDPAGAWAVLQVRDHGIGIPAPEIPRVFERFYRASNVVDRITGHGIGLAGAWHIVERHGGQLTVESDEGAGSNFSLRLPLGMTA